MGEWLYRRRSRIEKTPAAIRCVRLTSRQRNANQFVGKNRQDAAASPHGHHEIAAAVSTPFRERHGLLTKALNNFWAGNAGEYPYASTDQTPLHRD